MVPAELKLRSVEFSKAVRGYSCEEVDTYLAYANDHYAALVRECVELRRKMAAQAAGQNEYREEALREKDKIAAEAESLVEEGKKEAAKIIENARLKAARLLADAETAAAGILREAEKKAAAIPVPAPAEPVQKPADADFIAAQDNIADRMVAEIESFRQSVYNMYARHIEELEELGRLTDRFYETKEMLSGGYTPVPEQAETTEPEASPVEEETYMSAAETDSEKWDSAAESEGDILSSLYTEEEDDDFLRIDWSSHRAAREPAEDNADFFADAEKPEAEGKEEDFLSGFASEYLTTGQKAAKPDVNKQKSGTLDDLFASEEIRNVGLTGEFDFIYNSKKSADNVAQIRRQPLIDAQKPHKPKKHGK
ncbi:MAG: DivIVA domain-containing protein [Clostridia bacterium]|nr:DivIVA domain-containing protein [Clostridia bacterium]